MIQDHRVSVRRLQKDASNTSKEQYVANMALADVKCQIQPAGVEETAISDGVFGQVFLLLTTTSGILAGDNVTELDTGETYRVKGVENWGDIDLIPHYEATLVRMEEEEIPR